MEKQEYFLGLDMGTSSVGWAVTNTEYELLRKKGKDMWGIREFEEADSAEDRRTHRVDRRRRQRQAARLGLLKSYFSDAIDKIDPNFYIRLENSKYFLEDKDERVRTKNGIFDDENYKDVDYYEQYPTIFHLRTALLDVDNKGEKFDVRLVYLALANMFKHRGHFLLNAGGDALNTEQVDAVYQEVLDKFENDYELIIEHKPIQQVIDIISNSDTGRKKKHEEFQELFGVVKKDKRVNEILKCLCGLSVNAKLIFDEKTEEKVPLCFHDFSYTDKIAELMEQLTEEEYAIIEQLKSIYDYAVLAGTLKGYDYLSCARVELYEKHCKDLKLLKMLFRKYKTKEEYDKMFRSNADGTYSAYVNSLNSTDAIAESNKYRRNMKGRKADDIYSTIKKAFKDIIDDEDIKYVMEKIEKEQFLPKQLTGANGVIPNQVHKKEMERILKNAENYLPFLKEKDESGLTVSERIIQLFTFQIPYYVGPLGENSKTGWIVRKEEGAVLPWNINEKIDMGATSEDFIGNLIKTCTYIQGEKVMPKASLAYERYCVLNELNNLCIDGERLDTKLKQQIYKDCFMKGKRVTKKQLCTYLVAQSLISSEEQVTGIDKNINNSLSSYGKMYAIFGERLKEDAIISVAEDIIYWCTIFGDSKKMLKQRLTKYVEQGILDENKLKRILGYKFKDWGRFSKTLLTLSGCDKSTGEIMSLGQAMWEYSLNFMELINSDDFTFKEELAKQSIVAIKSLSDFTYEDLQDSYFSAPVKRMIWQTLLVVREIEQVMGYAPKRIFVEMTRTEEEKGDKGRKDSRGNQLLELYKSIKNTENHNWKQEISKASESGKLRSKKLFLYYMQMGRDMYTGEEIDLGRLYDDNLYDIDHIYPRHYVKDDSILNNLVLVNRQANQHIKKDLYPIPEQIKANQKVQELWNTLHRQKLITDEKYTRLISNTPFTEKQLGDFIARQLVETGQGTKGVATLLEQLFTDTDIVYAKASNVSDFRRDNGFLKSRLVNDFHHAQDAYLNIVVGNVYHTKFTKNPWNFIRKDYEKDKEKNRYNLAKMFEWDVIRGCETAWIAKRKDEKGTIATVRKMMQKNTPLLTRMNFEQHGGIANATLYSAKKAKPENYIPLKTSDIRMKDVTKYGGFTSATIAYYFIVYHKEGKKENVTIEGLPLYCKEKVEQETNGLVRYCKEVLGYGDVNILRRKLKIQSLLEINGYQFHLSGKTGDRLILRNAMSLYLPENWTTYIKKVEKAVIWHILEEEISVEQNCRLYDILADKHANAIYAKRPNAFGQKLLDGKEKFVVLNPEQQCEALLQLLQLTRIGTTEANLKLIGESEHSGKILISKNLKAADKPAVISQSATGLYEKKEWIFTEKTDG
ncbi:MAG: type II CRISPR RNA-guided endonuclease Cas9 [Catonella sp.]|uniref:type II CRISPR RNA-guided endonuclease Cas9 n=1 Tax=Catonella sp. TaxID=2382125 RepID=UPI003FA156A0